MIGQHKNLMLIQKWIKNKSFPRFIVITGREGSGRLTLAKEMIKRLDASGIIAENNSIDTVRQIIANAYRNNSCCVYIFRDIDDMSIGAQNALLKVVEEPPNNSYIICTAKNKEVILQTIRSRAVEIEIEPYSKEELKNFSDDFDVLHYALVPGDCDVDPSQITEAKTLAEVIIDTIYRGKGTDLLKYCSKLKNKDNEDGIDCKLFYRIFIDICPITLSVNTLWDYMKELESCLNSKSINNKSAIESFLLKVFVSVREDKRN